jgi:hypothetical protein
LKAIDPLTNKIKENWFCPFFMISLESKG